LELLAGNGGNLGKLPQKIHKKAENIFSPHATHCKSSCEYAKVFVDVFSSQIRSLQSKAESPSNAVFFLDLTALG
jgi:hypothetical protein